MTRVDGGELFVRTLEAAGVDTVFTLHGGHFDAIYQAARGRPLRFVDMRHEQAAGHAADGWARSTGRTGVALVTAGPGFTDCAVARASPPRHRRNDSTSTNQRWKVQPRS